MLRFFGFQSLPSVLVLTLALGGCSAGQPPLTTAAVAAPIAPSPRAAPASFLPRLETPREVLLGIDVLESGGFLPLRGKRVGLLTHPAGVDRHGVSTIDVLRRAPGMRLVALYSVEHGLYDQFAANQKYADQLDPRTGLMNYSLYRQGGSHKPTLEQLRGIDALVIDLQDIGVRAYTFTSAMKVAMEACFQNNIEVVVLDRPNPLGGLKVDGPMLDPQWSSQPGRDNYLGEFPVPYVHGLTIGELARMAKYQPGVLHIPEAVRARGHLIVIPMTGWRRGMRWPDTGLTWVPTSPLIPDFSAVVGDPMTGLGCFMGEPLGDPPRRLGGFSHGVGKLYPFRGISNRFVKSEVLERELDALNLPGLGFRRVSVPDPKTGKPATGLYIEVTDWDEWRPTELSFYLMKLDCKYSPRNPFAAASPQIATLFLHHMGSTAFFEDIAAHGTRVNVDAYVREWQARAKIYQEQSRRYWLYQ